MKKIIRIIRIFAYVGVLLCALGLGVYVLNAMRGDENGGNYDSTFGKVLGAGSSALGGASIGMMLGPIAGLILGCAFGAYYGTFTGSSSLDGVRKGMMLGLTLDGARKGMMLGLIAGLILGGAYGGYNEYNKPEAGGPTHIKQDDALISTNGTY